MTSGDNLSKTSLIIVIQAPPALSEYFAPPSLITTYPSLRVPPPSNVRRLPFKQFGPYLSSRPLHFGSNP